MASCYIHDTKSVIIIISTSDCLSAEFRNPRGFLSLKANELSRLGGGGGKGGKWRGGREGAGGEGGIFEDSNCDLDY